jgi:hypothetical protein
MIKILIEFYHYYPHKTKSEAGCIREEELE